MPVEAPERTNAMRILERQGIPFRVARYPVDEDDLSAVHAAEAMGMPADQVWKTIVLSSAPGQYFVCVIPGAAEVDLKKAAKASGAKKADLIPVKELEPLTGYVRGGCSPIGMKKAFPTFVDETVQLLDEISVSAGRRGLQVILKPEDLLRATGARLADVV